MTDSTLPIIEVIALLALFLIAITVFKYVIQDAFTRTRFMMTGLFLFIVSTLTIVFWPFALMTLPFTVPAFGVGILIGYLVGVQTERQKILVKGIEHYIEHFAHIEDEDFKNMTWWTVINFYSVTAALVLINLVGFTNVITHSSPVFVILTTAIGAALIGSIVPYLAHLWMLRFMK